MAYEIVWSKAADDSLNSILDYLYEVAGVDKAAEFVDLVYRKTSLLINNPYLRVASGMDKQIRRLRLTRNYCFYYRVYPEKQMILLLQIIDTRQNPGANPYES